MGKYNLTEKKEKNAAYRSLVRAELVDELYEKILKVFVVDKKLFCQETGRRVEYQHTLHQCRGQYPLPSELLQPGQ